MPKSTQSLWQRLKKLLGVTPQLPTDNNNPNKNNLDVSSASHGITLDNVNIGANPTNTSPLFLKNNEMNVDLTQLPSSDDIEYLLEQLGYHFMYHPPKADEPQAVHHYTMQVSDQTHEWGCMLRYFSNQQLLSIYSILPFTVPKNHRSDMLAVVNYLNYDLMIGNLELDMLDGEIRCKTSLDIEVTGLNEVVLSYLLQSNFSLISQLYDTLEAVVKKPKPAKTLEQAIDDLLLAQQEQMFYVMTEAIQ
ncbi:MULTISPECIES: YbjN domain-containing protein [unclassified Moraxella]|uniref:YbjN domain-containing protein n=1 Tax=unclassified Moraxella TaxID=2685852 RepID=UPI003AF5D036